MLTSSSVVKRKADQLLISKVDDEYLMMDIDKGTYISLNSTASIIWERIEDSTLISELITYLTQRFNIEFDECSQETLSFLNHLDELNVINSYTE